MVVRLGRREPELGDQPVHLVDDEQGLEVVEPRLAEDGDSLHRGGEAGSTDDCTCELFRPRHTCVQTPSTTSTKTRAPSHSRLAVDTSDAKSTCPGVSIRLRMCSGAGGTAAVAGV